MAQCTSSPPYDYWPECLANALRLLRCAADAWAMHGESDLSVERVLAVIVYAVTYPRSSGSMPLSIARCIEQVGPLPRLPGSPRHKQSPEPGALAELTQLLAMTAKDWSAGNPEDPPTAVVLHELVTVMFRYRIVQRPPPQRIED